MRIALSGASGYIGGNLAQQLKIAGHDIIKIERSDVYNTSQLSGKLYGTDAVINLSGAPILCRWTEANKKEILRSRVDSTLNIIEGIHNLPAEKRPKTYISASAIGIYTSGAKHTEESTSLSSDFVGEVVKQWEKSSSDLILSVRKIIFRIGLVLGKEANTMKKMLPLFRSGLGGKIGNGQQPFPFVHIDDVIQAILWAVQNQEVKGIYNLVAPQNITNEHFTKAFSEAVKRPAFFAVPEFVLKMVYGEAASLLIQSPNVCPERLIKSGYQFKYPDIQSTLAEIIK